MDDLTGNPDKICRYRIFTPRPTNPISRQRRLPRTRASNIAINEPNPTAVTHILSDCAREEKELFCRNPTTTDGADRIPSPIPGTPLPPPLPCFMATDDQLATERIHRLEAQARKAAKAKNDDRAQQYVRRARRIAERHRLELPKRFKRFTCNSCDRYLIPSHNATVRTREGHVAITCVCGAITRYPYRD